MQKQQAVNELKDQDIRQYLTFMIGGEEYAVSLLKVKEIIEFDVITKVPKMPEWVRGVINLRGNVVPVVDLAVKLRQAPSEIGKLTCIVITEVECDGDAKVIGVMADAVSQVIDLRAEEVEAPPSFGTRLKADYLLGMARSGKKFCLMLDTDKVLSSEELLDLNDAGESSVANEDEAILDIEPTSPVQDEAAGA